jgi:ankyrin repeat protein
MLIFSIIHYVGFAQCQNSSWFYLSNESFKTKGEIIFFLYRLLIKQGARVSDKDLEGNTPLHLAAESGNRSFSSLNEIFDEEKKL